MRIILCYCVFETLSQVHLTMINCVFVNNPSLVCPSLDYDAVFRLDNLLGIAYNINCLYYYVLTHIMTKYDEHKHFDTRFGQLSRIIVKNTFLCKRLAKDNILYYIIFVG